MKLITQKLKPTLFLGANLILPNKTLITKQFDKKKNLHTLHRIALIKIRLEIPVLLLIKQLEAKGYVIKRRQSINKYRAIRQNRLVSASELNIVKHFSSAIRGLVNYYTFACFRSNLWKVLHLLKKSCALTLASKFSKNSAKQIYEKYGKKLKIRIDSQIKTELYNLHH